MVCWTLRPAASAAVTRNEADPEAWLPTRTPHRVPTPAGESALDALHPVALAACQVVPPSQDTSTVGCATGTAVTPYGMESTRPNSNGTPAGARSRSSSAIGIATCIRGSTWWSPVVVPELNPHTVCTDVDRCQNVLSRV